MTIRPARPGDLGAIRRIVHDAYRGYIARLGKEPGPMRDDYARRIEAGQTWVTEHAGDVQGLVVLEAAGGALLLENIAVHPAAQGRGVGRALLAFVDAEARLRGCDAVRLYTHVLMTENLAIYRGLGFVETHRVTEDGFDRVYMTKGLE